MKYRVRWASLSPRNLHRTEEPAAGAGNGGVRNVRAQQADAVAFGVAEQFFEQDGNTVGFLPGGAAGAPDIGAHSAGSRATVDELRNDFVAEQIERRGIAKNEVSLVVMASTMLRFSAPVGSESNIPVPSYLWISAVNRL